MADPQKPAQPASAPAVAQPPASAANAPAASPAKKPLTPAEAELQRLKGDNWADPFFDPKIAREVADQQTREAAMRAIEWKKERGVYPWEEPESSQDQRVARQQEEWLRRAGIDPEKSRDEYLGRIKEAIRQIEAQKKTDGRGR
ncbi:MAG: hypothetical protein SFW64_00620 [Alphaproteobacteria bacterium]|nr:hypothetical protein [Alphaproteobacteria bacterium]